MIREESNRQRKEFKFRSHHIKRLLMSQDYISSSSGGDGGGGRGGGYLLKSHHKRVNEQHENSRMTTIMERGQMRGIPRVQVLCAKVFVVILISMLLILIQNSCQTSNSVPFKTSFVSSNDYYHSIRRNGAILSVPNVEQIQRDQADSIISYSSPAFEPTAEDENLAMISRELNFLQQNNKQKLIDSQQLPASDAASSQQSQVQPNQGGRSNQQAQSYMQILDDLKASQSVEASTGQLVAAANETVANNSTTTTTTNGNLKQQDLPPTTTLPPQPAVTGSPTTTDSSYVSSTSSSTTTTPTTTATPTPAPVETTTTINMVSTATNNDSQTNEQQQQLSNTSSSTIITVQPFELPNTTTVTFGSEQAVTSTSTTTTQATIAGQEASSSSVPVPAPDSEATSTIAPATTSSTTPFPVTTQGTYGGGSSSQTNDSSQMNRSRVVVVVADDASAAAAASVESKAIGESHKTINNQDEFNNISSTTTTTIAPNNRESRGRNTMCRFGEPDCSYVVATVPVVDKWKQETASGNKAGGSPTRIVNEFVLVPEADSALIFEDLGYSTRKPSAEQGGGVGSNSNTKEQTNLRAEHRTVDGDGSEFESSGFGAGSVDDIELDYIISSDSEPLSGKSGAPASPVRPAPATFQGPMQSAAATSGQTNSNTDQLVRQTTTTTTTESIDASTTSTTRQPLQASSTQTTLKPATFESNSSVPHEISFNGSKNIEASTTRTPPAPTTTVKPIIRISTSQSTSFSFSRSSTPAVLSVGAGGGQTVRQTASSPTGSVVVVVVDSDGPSTSTTTSTSTTKSPSTTRRTLGARPNQKLMRIGDHLVSNRITTTTASPTSTSATITSTSTTSSSSSPQTTTTTTPPSSTTTTRRPAPMFDWGRGGETPSGNRRPKSSRLLAGSQHRQFFSEPAGDLRRRPAQAAASGAAGGSRQSSDGRVADDNEEDILDRYTITTSQLSRLSAKAASTADYKRRQPSRAPSSASMSDLSRSSSSSTLWSAPRFASQKANEPQRLVSQQLHQQKPQIGSSSSPPPPVEQNEKHSRRQQLDSQQWGQNLAPIENRGDIWMRAANGSASAGEPASAQAATGDRVQMELRNFADPTAASSTAAARSATKQELVPSIEQSQTHSAIRQQQQQRRLNLNMQPQAARQAPGRKATGRVVEMVASIARNNWTTSGNSAATSGEGGLSLNNERIGAHASNRQSPETASSSMGAYPQSQSQTVATTTTTTMSSTTSNAVSASGQSLGSSAGGDTNRLQPPVTTTTSSTTFRPDTITTTTVAPGKTEIAPMTTTSTSTTPSPGTSEGAAATVAVGDTTTETSAPISTSARSNKRELSDDLRQVGQTEEAELMALIAQTVATSGGQEARPSASNGSSLLLSDANGYQARRQPIASSIESASRLDDHPAGGKVATPVVVDNVQLPASLHIVNNPASRPELSSEKTIGHKQPEPAPLATLHHHHHHGSRRPLLEDDLDEYEGSVEDQLAKDDALHYHNQPSASSLPKKITSNAYTTKANRFKGPSATTSAASSLSLMVDSGKWQPGTFESDSSMASGTDDSGGQANGANPLPGRPGIDYPIHWQVPKTSFDCRNYEQSGFYADVESDCQAYHSCHKGRGGRHTFLCPNGTLFSQELLTCDWWYNVECSASKLYLTNESGSSQPTNSLDHHHHQHHHQLPLNHHNKALVVGGSDGNNRANTNELSM